MQAIDMTELVRQKLRYYDLSSFGFLIQLERRRFIGAINDTVNTDAPDAVEMLQKVAEIDERLKKAEQEWHAAVKLLSNLAEDAKYGTTPPTEF